MIVQLAIGFALISATCVAAGMSWWGLETMLNRLHNWSVRPPHGPKLVIVLCVALFWTFLLMTVSMWIWTAAFHVLGLFETLEDALYFALVAFTTLGFGDILLPREWQLLSGLAAANGLLIFGILTAMLVETLRDTRVRQRDLGRLKS